MLERVRIEEVTEKVLNFSESATIKIGELMNVPRNARIQNLANEKKKKEAKASSDKRNKEGEAKKAAALAKIRQANEAAWRELQPTVAAWSKGEGDAAEVKRFGRKKELQLLAMTAAEAKVRHAHV